MSGNLIDLLQKHAGDRPNRTALTFLGDGESVTDTLTYAALDDRARAIGAYLQETCHAGDRALLAYSNGLHNVAAFFGCLYAGVIAVPVYFPESRQPGHLAKLGAIIRHAKPRLILTNGELLDHHAATLEAVRQDASGILATDRLQGLDPSAWKRPELRSESIAFLQYTSGSTAAPKGVKVGHDNILANSEASSHAFGAGESDTMVSWLPLFHDMGLIGGLLQPIYKGSRLVLMDPRHFAERPLRWLKAVTRHGGHISGGPDFAYRLCAERVSESLQASLDLSTWRIAFCGSEPIRPDTLRAFIKAFSASGFNPGAFYPCYGLAEATLFVSGGLPGRGATVQSFDGEALASKRAVTAASKGIPLVACGAVQPFHELKIVDPLTLQAVPDGQVGEIQIAGPSVTPGYWEDARATASAFVSRGERTFFRTGDLGFRHDAQLYITGRIKDLLIVRGRNLYPQDIERAVETHVQELRKGRVAAFSVERNAEERIGIAAEVTRRTLARTPSARLMRQIADAVAEEFQQSVAVVLLLNPGAMPKTSSGKLQRSACREAWRNGSLGIWAEYEDRDEESEGNDPASAPHRQPLDEPEKTLAAIWSDVLGRAHIGLQDDFFKLGGHSLLAAQMLARVRDAFGCELPLRALFEASSLSQFAKELEKARQQPSALHSLRRMERPGSVPLSFAQQRLWFLAQLRPHSAAYNVVLSATLTGELNGQALRHAIDALVERHEALRTTLQVERGTPRQIVHSQMRAPIAAVDLRSCDEAQRNERAATLAKAEALKPFDLQTGPLFRVHWLQLEDQRHRLLVSVHHIVSDGWSMQVLMEDLLALYQQQCSGESSSLLPLLIQYADYTLWQHEAARSPERQQRVAEWRERITESQGEEDSSPLALPVDRPRPGVPTYEGSAYRFVIDDELTDALRRLAAERGATLFMVLLTAFKVLLCRYSGESALRIGVTVANRPRVELERLIGFFVDTQVWRTDLSGDPRFDELLQQVKGRALDAQDFADIPFDQLVEAVNPRRDLAYNPLFQVSFNHQWIKAPYLGMQGPTGLSVESVERELHVTQFDLILDTQEQGARLSGSMIYSTDLFDQRTVERITRHWVNLLRQIVKAPTERVLRFALLSEDERAEVLAHCQARRAVLPGVPGQHALVVQPNPVADEPIALSFESLHVLFERQAHVRGEAVALVTDREQLSYRELNARANRLAHKLRERGVGPEVLVGLCLHRGVELIVSILAVLKAGGAYLPLEPNDPTDRLNEVLADARPEVLITERALLDQHAAAFRHALTLERVLCVDAGAFDLSNDESGDLPNLTKAHHLAYCIYTSGSTGRPKGALLTHANVLRLFDSCREHCDLRPSDVWTLFHSCAFDFSVWEIFGALLYGGRLVVVPHVTSRSPRELYDLLCREGVTVLSQTPSAFSQLAPVALRQASLQEAPGLSLRYVVFGGEALSLSSVRPWLERFGDERPVLINMYGITETTVHVTYRRLRLNDVRRNSGNPIGRALCDLSAYVLNEHFQPVPFGVSGELYVGGAGVARGYLGRAALTAQRFVPDVFGGSGARLYRTGDRARYNTHGELEYLGRLDDQVKIRGYRIELGEIEARLRAQPEVQEARVLVQGQEPAGKRLVGYVVLDHVKLRASEAPATVVASPERAATPSPVQASLKKQWRAVFDDTYEESTRAPSFVGWRSSYTDEPIEQAQMQQWLSGTVARIRAPEPRRVLEIGCGVGLLVRELAGGCTEYWGTDLSEQAVQRLGAWAQDQPQLRHVKLRCQPADDLSGIPERAFDTVVLNSVVQYFPDIEYLVGVLRGALRCVSAGGRVFIGDVRHAGLLDLFHTSVQLARSSAGLRLSELKARIDRALLQEKELVIAPELFERLSEHLPVRCESVRWKEESTRNELTNYRYDVVLESIEPGEKRDAESHPAEQGGERRFEREWHASTVSESRPARLSLEGVARSRLAADIAASRLLQQMPGRSTVGQLRERVAREAELRDRRGEWPEAFSALANASGYDAPLPKQSLGINDDAWARSYANDPRLGIWSQTTGATLRERLKASLPVHMVPAQIVVLRKLPLTGNGKLDRQALPELRESHSAAEYVAPRSPLEQRLAQVWQSLLGIERIGLNDHFFEIGGHSLLATQLISRIREELAVEVPLRLLFAAPKLENFAEHIEQLLTAGMAGSSQSRPAPRLQPLPRNPVMPVSLSQQRLWLVHELLKESGDAASAYNMAGGFRLHGEVRADAITTGLNALVARHEVLRTAFPVGPDGAPVTQIHERLTLDIPFIDLSHLPLEDSERRITEAVSAGSHRPFDLARAPLMRAALYKLRSDEHVLLLVLHHIVADGWSVSLLMREISETYQAALESRAPNLRPLALQYADYAVWQRERLQNPYLQREITFWKTYLEGAPRALSLPTDLPRPPVASLTGNTVDFSISRELLRAVQTRAAEAGVTTYMLLLASFQWLLHRFTNSTDVVIGTDVAGRSQLALEELIGFFVNVVPLRSRTQTGMDFSAMLQHVKQNVLNAFEHQELPFDQIVDALNIPRDRSRNPLVQALFVLQSAPAGVLEIKGVRTEPLIPSAVHSKFDMALFLEPRDEGLSAQWVYARALFKSETIEQLAQVWVRWLEKLTAFPSERLDNLEWPSALQPSRRTPTALESKTVEHRKLERLKRVIAQRPVMRVVASPSVRSAPLNPERLLPLLIEPEGVGFSAVAWVRANGAFIEEMLCRHGALLFRDFGLRTAADFEAFAEAIDPKLYGEYGDLPKKEGGRQTYRSTPYPPDRMILWHNESSHLGRWPRKQWFFCEQPSPRGGATPLSECREIYRRLPRDVAARFEQKKLMYVRTFTKNLDVDWRDFFKTSDRKEVERRCEAVGTQARWLNGEELQTRTICPALITHPVTGERSFFNQIQLHHPYCLEPDVREALLSMVGPERMPRQVYYGDGTPIEDEVMELIGRLYEECAVRFVWRQGDVAMLDNMLVAHARDPFEGERKIVVAMAEMIDRASLPVEREIMGAHWVSGARRDTVSP